VQVFYTHAISTTFDRMVLPRGITLFPGRPKFDKLLDTAVADMLSAGGTSGVFVGVCDPVTLAKAIVGAVGTADARVRKSVGGVELHEEIFGW